MANVFEATQTMSKFGATSTTEDVLSGINLRATRILVTGVSAGSELKLRGLLPLTVRTLWARLAT